MKNVMEHIFSRFRSYWEVTSEKTPGINSDRQFILFFLSMNSDHLAIRKQLDHWLPSVYFGRLLLSPVCLASGDKNANLVAHFQKSFLRNVCKRILPDCCNGKDFGSPRAICYPEKIFSLNVFIYFIIMYKQGIWFRPPQVCVRTLISNVFHRTRSCIR